LKKGRLFSLGAASALAVTLACGCDLLFDRGGQAPRGSEGLAAPRSSGGPATLLPDGIVLRDSFDDNRNRWEIGEGFGIAAGAFSFSPGATPKGATVPVAVANGRIRVVSSFKGGAQDKPFGVTFRYKDHANYHFMYVTAGGLVTFGKVVNGAYGEMSPLTHNAGLVAGANVLEVSCSGYRIDYAVNGVEAGIHYTDVIEAGRAGFFVSEGCAVAFDEFHLTDFEARPPDVLGTVSQGGVAMARIPVRLVVLTDLAAMEGRLLTAAFTDPSGRYAFRLPDDGTYLIEAGASPSAYAAGQGTMGSRLIDTRLYPLPATRDIILSAVSRPAGAQ
jgi:hypothetical protein